MKLKMFVRFLFIVFAWWCARMLVHWFTCKNSSTLTNQECKYIHSKKLIMILYRIYENFSLKMKMRMVMHLSDWGWGPRASLWFSFSWLQRTGGLEISFLSQFAKVQFLPALPGRVIFAHLKSTAHRFECLKLNIHDWKHSLSMTFGTSKGKKLDHEKITSTSICKLQI